MVSFDMCDKIEKLGRRKSKQAKLSPYKVANDEERVAIMEWVQQHPFLYDKSSEDVSNKQAKKHLYREKANEMGIEGAGDEAGQRLQTWVKTRDVKKPFFF